MEKRRHPTWTALILALLIPAGAFAQQKIEEFSLADPESSPYGITAGPDGAIWFTESEGNKIGRLTSDGTILEFGIPTADSEPGRIIAGPDGALWFVEWAAGKIGRITTSGIIEEFPLTSASSHPSGLASGPDGAIWFTEFDGGKVGKLSTGGQIQEFALDGDDGPDGIVLGADGNLWFTEAYRQSIGRVTPSSGAIEQIALADTWRYPSGIVAGPAANLWFTETPGDGSAIGKLAANGAVSEFENDAYSPFELCMGPDGNVWFTESDGEIGTVSPSGAITRFNVPTVGSWPWGITTGSDGAIWFTESGTGKIGRLDPGTNSRPLQFNSGISGRSGVTPVTTLPVAPGSTSGARP